MKKALITGDEGFVGRWMRRELESRGWLVRGVDLSSGGLYHWLNSGYADHTYDLVVHLAYVVGGRASIDGKNLNLADNVSLDASLFDWAVRTGQRRVLYFSSSAAYPVWHQSKNFVEDELFGGAVQLNEGLIDLDYLEQPDADYGFAKLVGERLARSARRMGLPVTVVRPFSGYGEDQSLDYPFPSIVKRASQGDLTVWGPPGQTRDWIHISDIVNGALAVAESETEEPVNLCTGVGTEMGDLALKAFWATADVYLPPKVKYDETKPTGVFYRVGDPARMHQFYTPKVEPEEGIQLALNAL